MASGILPLVRRWAVDWLNGQDASVLPEILSEDYVLHIGGHDLTGRDAYRGAVLGQFREFPGLVLTVHEVMTDGTRAAVRFTEHGASVRQEGRTAAWVGIAMFRAEDGRLVETYAEEDYLSRRRQLADGRPDPIEAAHADPWGVPTQTGDEVGEAAVRGWLDRNQLWTKGIQLDDTDTGADSDGQGVGGELLRVDRTDVDELFSAGGQVAFHVTQHGTRRTDGQRAQLRSAGLVEVADGAVAAGHVIRDRLGLLRAPAVVRS